MNIKDTLNFCCKPLAHQSISGITLNERGGFGLVWTPKNDLKTSSEGSRTGLPKRIWNILASKDLDLWTFCFYTSDDLRPLDTVFGVSCREKDLKRPPLDDLYTFKILKIHHPSLLLPQWTTRRKPGGVASRLHSASVTGCSEASRVEEWQTHRATGPKPFVRWVLGHSGHHLCLRRLFFKAP